MCPSSSPRGTEQQLVPAPGSVPAAVCCLAEFQQSKGLGSRPLRWVRIELWAYFIQPFAKCNYGSLRQFTERRLPFRMKTHGLYIVLAFLIKENQIKLPFAPICDVSSYLMRQRELPLPFLSRAL